MPWYDYIKVANLDTSLTDEEAATTTPPDEDAPADLAPCPAMFYEVFTGISNGDSVDDGTDDEQPVEDDITTQLDAWLNAVDSWFADDWEKWIDDTIAFSESEGTRGDLPAPIPPTLPDLPDFISLPALIAQFGPWGVVVWVGIKVVKRLIEAWIEKKMNPGIGDLKTMLQDIRDALKKGLLYNDGADSLIKKALLFDSGPKGANQAILDAGLLFTDKDSKDKGTLERAFIYENQLNQLVSYLAALPDLAYVDTTVDFGAFRCHIRGKMIEY